MLFVISDYVDDLMTRVATALSQEVEDTVSQLQIPPPLNANFMRPSKRDAVRAHVSRFQST